MLEEIYTRRSIRSFTNKKVTRKDIEKIIEAGLRAPSSKNSNPWHIIILEGKEKDFICDFVLANKDKKRTKPVDIATGKEVTFDSTDASVKIIKEAPVLILILNRGPFSGGIETLVKNSTPDNIYTYSTEILGIGACMENMLLACHSLELGAVPMSDIYPADSEIKRRFGVNYDFIVGIALGYPAYKAPKRPIEPEKYVKFGGVA